jgi:hypothetical protein
LTLSLLGISLYCACTTFRPSGQPEPPTDAKWSDGDSSLASLDSSAPDATNDAPPLAETAEADVGRIDALVRQINFNGPEYNGGPLGAYAGLWEADVGHCGQAGPASVPSIQATGSDPLFLGELFGAPLQCEVRGPADQPWPIGAYEVTLYFAETYFGAGCMGGGGLGSRIFSVDTEGIRQATDLDVFKEGGGCLASTATAKGAHPIQRTFQVMVVDGSVSLKLTPSADNATLTAIRIAGPR